MKTRTRNPTSCSSTPRSSRSRNSRLEELDDSEPLLLAGESPDFDELSDPLRDLSFSFAPSAAGTVEPLRLSVR